MANGLVPTLSATYPAISTPFFNCEIAIAPMFPYDPSQENLPHDLFILNKSAVRYLGGVVNHDHLQHRIDQIVGLLQQKQAETPGKCLRAFVDYAIKRSLPAKLCHAAQRIDLAWARSALTYMGNNLLDQNRKACGIACMLLDWTDYRDEAMKGFEEVQKVEACQAKLRDITDSSHLFQRYHQSNNSFEGSALVETSQVPRHYEYYDLPKTPETDAPAAFAPGFEEL